MTSTTTDIFDITGKRALVTGASRGIGRAIAVALAEAGAHVVAAARTENALKETAALASGARGQIDILATDLRTPESAEAAIHSAAETLGGLDILVNNAADDHDSPIEKTDLKVYQRIMDLNLQSCWVMTKAASPYLKDGGGKVINIASVLGLVGMLDDSVYIAAKHGLVGLTKAVALEWARAGVQVNAIAPGFVDTAMIGNLKENEALQAYVKKKTPMGRAAQPEEYAGPTLFLASSASDFMTGQVLVVDGGYSTQ
ncbi:MULTISPECIES: SDR family oxidoreductase [unclassified Streptomyces]|uniref:SDR family NAD(P)-dependent oxidoreductase n=1 Tax=unclassified Streptomyces TaxID=2593676 RepID=UPI0033F742C7